MKDSIHPKVYTDAVITCACGNSFVTISTQPAITIEICSSCHPFYTGQQKFVDTEGRIDKFVRKQQIAQTKKLKAEEKKKEKQVKALKAKLPKETPTLKEMLEQARNQNS